MHVADHAIIGGKVGIHQYVRIGQGCIIGGLCKIVRDVIPFTLVDGAEAHLKGLNLIGLRRNKACTHKDITALKNALKVITNQGSPETAEHNLQDRVQTLLHNNDNPWVETMVRFITDHKSKRSYHF